jgi:F-type H+-transporting ATPase subunit b
VELNWSTFILEIINFLVLVWILKRFLYKPVLAIIARRREGIEKAMADANDLNTQAHDLQQQYENRLSDWEGEKQKAREALGHEIDAQAAGFAARLLKGLSGPELEARLLALLLEQLPQMEEAQVARLRQSQSGGEVEVCSAFALDETQRRSLQQALEQLLGSTPPVRYEQQDALLAGVRITIGAWVLGANLEDELKGFAELGHGAE